MAAARQSMATSEIISSNAVTSGRLGILRVWEMTWESRPGTLEEIGLSALSEDAGGMSRSHSVGVGSVDHDHSIEWGPSAPYFARKLTAPGGVTQENLSLHE
jgi:hypothetical protein